MRLYYFQKLVQIFFVAVAVILVFEPERLCQINNSQVDSQLSSACEDGYQAVVAIERTEKTTGKLVTSPESNKTRNKREEPKEEKNVTYSDGKHRSKHIAEQKITEEKLTAEASFSENVMNTTEDKRKYLYERGGKKQIEVEQVIDDVQDNHEDQYHAAEVEDKLPVLERRKEVGETDKNHEVDNEKTDSHLKTDAAKKAIVGTDSRKLENAGTEVKNADNKVKNADTEVEDADIKVKNDGTDIKNADSKVKNADNQVKNAGTEVKNADNKVKNADNKVKNADKEVKNTDTEIKNADNGVKKPNIEVKNADKEVKNADTEIKNADNGVKKPNIEVKNAESEVKDADTDAKNADDKVKKAHTEVKNADSEVKNAGNKFEYAKEKLEKSVKHVEKLEKTDKAAGHLTDNKKASEVKKTEKVETTTEDTVEKNNELKIITADENGTDSSEWKHVEFGGQKLQLRSISCVPLTTSDIVGVNDVFKPSLDRLRLFVLLVLSSFLLLIINISLYYFAKNPPALIQVIFQNLLHVAIWMTGLVFLELQRRSWDSSWLDKSSFVPVYPLSWLILEVISFIVTISFIIEMIIHKKLDNNLRVESSRGVYSVLSSEQEEEDVDYSIYRSTIKNQL